MNHSEHTFHIPVMGLGFTIDTPVKVARFGISSVVSIIEDHLVEQMRAFYCDQEGEEYFPIKVGTIKYYQVDTLFYSSFTGETDTVSNLYKEEIIEKMADIAGDSAYRVELSLFNEVRSKWETKVSFSRKLSGNNAIESIYNNPEVKMLFPISSYKTKGSSYIWNLNMFSNNDVTNVKYYTLLKSYNNQLGVFYDCVSVGLQYPETGIVNNIREEVYAKNIGLVYRHIEQTDLLSTLGNRNGFEIFVRLLP